MKTKFISIALLLTVITAGCNKQANADYTIECGKFYITETEFVSWCIVPPVVSENSENMQILVNHTERVLRFGEIFSLDYFHKGEWIPLDLTNQHWLEIYNGIRPGETLEGYANTMLLYFVKKYNNSKKGKYRMGRSYSVYSVGNPGNMYEFSFILYAEFVIK